MAGERPQVRKPRFTLTESGQALPPSDELSLELSHLYVVVVSLVDFGKYCALL